MQGGLEGLECVGQVLQQQCPATGERNKRVRAGVSVRLRMAAKNEMLAFISWCENNNQHSLGHFAFPSDFHSFTSTFNPCHSPLGLGIIIIIPF